MTGTRTGRPREFSTVGLPETQRVELWERHNTEALIGLRCRTLQDRTLEATEVNLQLPRLHLARVTGNPHVVERTAEMVRRSPSASVACYVTLDGEAFFYCDDAVRTVRPGQLIVCDADRPFMRGFSQGLEELVIKIPGAVLAEVAPLDLVREPLVVDTRRDLGARTLAQLVGRALRPGGWGDVEEEVIVSLLGAAVTGRTTGSAAAHLATARAYVEGALADHGLSAARVAGAVGISERHLSRILADSGTSFPQYVLSRRLERAHRLLRTERGLSVAEVATRCGFGSAAHFSHAFVQRFGLRASDVRRGAGDNPGQQPS